MSPQLMTDEHAVPKENIPPPPRAPLHRGVGDTKDNNATWHKVAQVGSQLVFCLLIDGCSKLGKGP